MLVLVAALTAGCQTRDPEAQPFHITAVDAAGTSIAAGATTASLITLQGTASRLGPSALVVTGTSGATVTVRFDPGDPPGDAFPDVVASGTVRVDLLQDPASKGPGGAPLPFRGLRVADSNGRFRFFIGEGDLVDGQGVPLVPRPLGPEAAGEDLPVLLVVAPGTPFTPSSCGDVFRDRLLVHGGASDVLLREGDRADVTLTATHDLPPWSVRLMAVWHRVGDPVHGGGCDGALRAWFQAAGAR